MVLDCGAEGNDRNWETEGDLCPRGSRNDVAAALELNQNVRMGSLCKDGEEGKKKTFQKISMDNKLHNQ